MSGEPQMFRINPENRASEKITHVDFANLGLREVTDIQEWIAANPGILGDDLLIISKEFRGFDRTNERLDLLAVDYDGNLVIIELKRDDTGADAHWQAIKYASYLRHANADEIVGMLANYAQIPKSEAINRLLHHLQADDFTILNNDQRIILASHRFAREVTTAVLWLNEKSPNLITCIQLMPYHDQQQGTLYVQASTIIPLPGVDDYLVRVGDSVQEIGNVGGNARGENLARSFAESRIHPTTPFLKRVGDLAIEGLPDEIKPDKRSRWSGVGGGNMRYYHLWYSRHPWSNWDMSYRVNLFPEGESGEWRAYVEFRHDQNGLRKILDDIAFHDRIPAALGLENYDDGFVVNMGSDTLNDDFGDRIAETVRTVIEAITPAVNDLEDADNEEDI